MKTEVPGPPLIGLILKLDVTTKSDVVVSADAEPVPLTVLAPP
jgi:hypothetical protein